MVIKNKHIQQAFPKKDCSQIFIYILNTHIIVHVAHARILYVLDGDTHIKYKLLYRLLIYKTQDDIYAFRHIGTVIDVDKICHFQFDLPIIMYFIRRIQSDRCHIKVFSTVLQYIVNSLLIDTVH